MKATVHQASGPAGQIGVLAKNPSDDRAYDNIRSGLQQRAVLVGLFEGGGPGSRLSGAVPPMALNPPLMA